MSIISTKPKVKSVVNARVLDNVRSVAEVMVCASVLNSTKNPLRQRTQASRHTSTIEAVAPVLENILRSQQRKFGELRQQKRLSQLDALKASTLDAIADSPFVVSNPEAISAPLKTITASKSVAEVTRAGRVLLKEIALEHNRVLTNSLRVACANAFLKIGFTNVQTMAGRGAKVRLVASNPDGKTLVTEIEADASQDLSISTEIVSGCDSTSQDILDAYDKALEEEGVRAAAPVRKETGGVCQLESARMVEAANKFVKNKLQPTRREAPSANPSDNGARRSQRLNKKELQQQRQRQR